MDFGTLLEKAGPYTAPLCMAMFWAIQWLLSDRKRLLSILSEKENRERQVSDKRIEDGLESARLLAESNKTQTETLTNHDRVLGDLTKRVEDWLSSQR